MAIPNATAVLVGFFGESLKISWSVNTNNFSLGAVYNNGGDYLTDAGSDPSPNDGTPVTETLLLPTLSPTLTPMGSKVAIPSAYVQESAVPHTPNIELGDQVSSVNPLTYPHATLNLATAILAMDLSMELNSVNDVAGVTGQTAAGTKFVAIEAPDGGGINNPRFFVQASLTPTDAAGTFGVFKGAMFRTVVTGEGDMTVVNLTVTGVALSETTGVVDAKLYTPSNRLVVEFEQPMFEADGHGFDTVECKAGAGQGYINTGAMSGYGTAFITYQMEPGSNAVAAGKMNFSGDLVKVDAGATQSNLPIIGFTITEAADPAPTTAPSGRLLRGVGT